MALLLYEKKQEIPAVRVAERSEAGSRTAEYGIFCHFLHFL